MRLGSGGNPGHGISIFATVCLENKRRTALFIEETGLVGKAVAKQRVHWSKLGVFVYHGFSSLAEL